MNEENNINQKIGGWLILVGIGIVLSPIRIVVMVFPLYSGMMSDGTWAALTTEGSEFYQALWEPILTMELVVNGALVVGWLYVAYLFFSHKKQFPIFYIGILLFSLLFILADAFTIKLVMPEEPVFDPDTIKELARSAIACIIWIPYMLISKRVKSTFTR